MEDSFDTSKANPKMIELVARSVKDSYMDKPDTVIVTTKQEW